jgi:mxaJ protein
MSSPFRRPAILAIALVLMTAVVAAETRELRVCADPDNMPFSNMQRQGFENHIASLVAAELGARLTYVWQRMGRGFVREYIDKSQCDLVVGIPSNFRPLLTTSPYYRSSYFFVLPREDRLEAISLDAPELHRLRIGVQVLEENYTPPGAALARRGLQAEMVGFDTTGQGADSIIRAVAERKVDIAVVWGPLAGYFVKPYRDSLKLAPVEPEIDPPGLPFTFAISMGVRKGNVGLRNDLEKVLSKREPEIRKILAEYSVPLLPLAREEAAKAVN